MNALDQAIRRLKAEQPPAGPSAELVDTTLGALRHAENAARPRDRGPTKARGRAAGMVVMIALGFACITFFGSRGPTALAFAEVLAQLQEHEAVCFTLRWVTETDDVDRSQAWSVEGPLVRLEGMGIRQVWNRESREILELDLAAKTARRATMDHSNGRDFFDDPVQHLRVLAPEDGVHVRPEEGPDGKVLDLYHVASTRRLMGSGTTMPLPLPLPMQVWVDRETGLPVRIRLQTSFNRQGVKEQDRLEWADFDWSPEFADGCFDLEVPEGFEEQER